MKTFSLLLFLICAGASASAATITWPLERRVMLGGGLVWDAASGGQTGFELRIYKTNSTYLLSTVTTATNGIPSVDLMGGLQTGSEAREFDIDILPTFAGGTYGTAVRVQALFDNPNGTNRPPIISTPQYTLTMSKNGELVLPITVDDELDDPGALTLSRASSNQTLLPTANCVLGGSGANRTIDLQPAVGVTGETTVTIGVADSQGATNYIAAFISVADVPFPNRTGTRLRGLAALRR